MNRIRTTSALAVLLPALLAAAEAPPGGDRPFESVRQDLGALKTANPAVAPGPALDLGAAAGIGAAGNFAAPPAVTAPPRAPENGATAQSPKSSGWLLDALEENSRRTGTQGLSSTGRDGSTARDDQESDPKNNQTQTRDSKRTTLPNSGNSPLSAYLAGWLGPDEYRRLGNLYPELSGKGGPPDSLAGPGTQRSPEGPGPASMGMTTQEAARIAPGSFGTIRPQDNPFIQAMQIEPRTVAPVVPAPPPRIVTPPPAMIAAPAPEAVRTPATMPEAPGADNRRYFPQLKRF